MEVECITRCRAYLGVSCPLMPKPSHCCYWRLSYPKFSFQSFFSQLLVHCHAVKSVFTSWHHFRVYHKTSVGGVAQSKCQGKSCCWVPAPFSAVPAPIQGSSRLVGDESITTLPLPDLPGVPDTQTQHTMCASGTRAIWRAQVASGCTSSLTGQRGMVSDWELRAQAARTMLTMNKRQGQ